MASQHLASIPHNSDTDTVSVSSELDSRHPPPAPPPTKHVSAVAGITSSSELDDELDSLVQDQFHHRFPDYHDQHHHHSSTQTQHDARDSSHYAVSASASRPPSYRRSRFQSVESAASGATSLYSSRSSHPPRTTSLSQSSSSVPPLFANSARASATPIKRKPLSVTASSLATAFQRSSVASSTAASTSVVTTPVVPPLPHPAAAAHATAPLTTTTAAAAADPDHDDDDRINSRHTAAAAESYTVDLPEPHTRFARPPSLDSPTLYHFAPATLVDRLPAFQ